MSCLFVQGAKIDIAFAQQEADPEFQDFEYMYVPSFSLTLVRVEFISVGEYIIFGI